MRLHHLFEKDKLELPDLEVGDEIKVGKFKNRKAEITGFDKDEHNQPVMKTTKGDQKVFKNRHSKLEESAEPYISARMSSNKKVVFIDMMEVPKDLRGKGVGSDYYLNWENNLPSTVERVELFASDTGAGNTVGFWEAMGFDFKYENSDDYETQYEMWKGVNGHSTPPPIDEILDEASYAGNIGIMELIKFKKVATPAIKALVDNLIGQGRNREAWKIIQKQTRTKLKGKQFEQDLSEITMDHRTSKGEFDRSDLDEFIDRAYPVGNVKGYKIFLFDEDEPEEVHYLVGDPNSEGFLGYVSLIFGERDKFYRTNVFFDPEIQGKGLAVPLYAFAIKHSGQTVVSDLTQTKGSKLLWQKLAKMPGINVYGWDTDKNEYFHWDPDTDEENEVWQDTRAVADEVALIRKKMVAIHNDYEDGKMSQQDYEQLTKQYKDEADAIQNQRQNYRSDIRLVATTK